MSKCSHNRDVLDAYILGLGGLDDLDRQHTGSCGQCGNALAEAERMRSALSEYAGEIGRRADQILEENDPAPLSLAGRGRSWGVRFAPWLATAAAVVLIVLASAILRQEVDLPAQPEGGAGLRYLRQVDADARRGAMTAYLSQTQTLFLSLLYGATDCEEGTVEIAAEKELARDLLRRKKLLEPELSQPGRVDIRPIFDELELLLLEVAGGEDCISQDQFKSWKQTVENRRTLQRLQLLQMKGRI